MTSTSFFHGLFHPFSSISDSIFSLVCFSVFLLSFSLCLQLSDHLVDLQHLIVHLRVRFLHSFNHHLLGRIKCLLIVLMPLHAFLELLLHLLMFLLALAAQSHFILVLGALLLIFFKVFIGPSLLRLYLKDINKFAVSLDFNRVNYTCRQKLKSKFFELFLRW